MTAPLNHQKDAAAPLCLSCLPGLWSLSRGSSLYWSLCCQTSGGHGGVCSHEVRLCVSTVWMTLSAAQSSWPVSQTHTSCWIKQLMAVSWSQRDTWRGLWGAVRVALLIAVTLRSFNAAHMLSHEETCFLLFLCVSMLRWRADKCSNTLNKMFKTSSVFSVHIMRTEQMLISCFTTTSVISPKLSPVSRFKVGFILREEIHVVVPFLCHYICIYIFILCET